MNMLAVNPFLLSSAKPVFAGKKPANNKPKLQPGSRAGLKSHRELNRQEPLSFQAKLHMFGELLHQEYLSRLRYSVAEIRSVFKGSTIKARPKDPVSIQEKLLKVHRLYRANISTLEGARKNVWDAIGTRVILKNPTAGGIERLTDKLERAIAEGRLQVVQIQNYQGMPGKPYFKKHHLDRLQQAAGNKPFKVVHGDQEAYHPYGYTATHLQIRHKNGSLGEIQILGPKVEQLAETLHPLYDVLQGKDLSKGNPAIAKLVAPFQTLLQNIDDGQKEIYFQYLTALFLHARRQEIGEPSVEPLFPLGMNPLLHIRQVERFSEAYHQLKRKQLSTR